MTMQRWSYDDDNTDLTRLNLDFSFPCPSAPAIEETASKSHQITTNQMNYWFSPE